jgi:hypothetical protein
LSPGVPPAYNAGAARLAEELTRAETERSVKGIARKIRIPASAIEEELDRFHRAGWIALTWKIRSGTKILDRVRVFNREVLEEFSHPGRAQQRRAALEAARGSLQNLHHPIAVDILGKLGEGEAESWDSDLVRALAAVALHVESGEQVAERVLSTQNLGNSKALRRVRSRIQRLLGQELAELGIREGPAVTLIGGSGFIEISGSGLNVAGLRPFFGLARETLTENIEITPPPAGLFLVENLTVFDACCRAEVNGLDKTMLIWTAGYPGRAVRSLIENASRRGARMRIWADIDLDGVRIARLVQSWASNSNVEAFRMSPEDLAAAPQRLDLSERSRSAISADLSNSPHGFLADTLRALLKAGSWVEQECFLANAWRKDRL